MARLVALRAQNFRCFRHLACDLADGATLFIGDNAQGKTSVLEAACVLIRLHSPRTTSLADLARFGEAGFGISGDLVPAGGTDTTRLQVLLRAGNASSPSMAPQASAPPATSPPAV